MLEFVFHGTGTSSSLPHIKCLTDPDTNCRTCPSTFTPEGKKNIRRNTGAIIRKRVKSTTTSNGESVVEERDVVVVIDVGKTFLASALEWFPKYGFRKIDAILLTHAHADAINGLDDLRSWTLGGAVQNHIDIYASLTCFNEIKRAFPYLVSKDFATGGGDVPEFRWHIIKEHETFEIEGGAFWITPVAVDHGRQFPSSKVQQTGSLGLLTPHQQSPLPSGNCTPSNDPICAPVTSPNKAPAHIPFKCFGFIINSTIFYLSDVSHIPEEEWKTILHPSPKPLIESDDSNELIQPNTPDSERMPLPTTASYSMMVVDTLKPKPHVSHFGIKQAVQTARRVGAKRNYMVGFTHELNHDDWVAIGEALGQEDWITKAKDQPQPLRAAVELVEQGPPVWLRPAFDGMRVYVPEPDDEDQTIIDGYS